MNMQTVMDNDHLSLLIKESITLLCKNALTYDIELAIEGLLGITLDKKNVLLVNIKDNIHTASFEPTLEESVNSSGKTKGSRKSTLFRKKNNKRSKNKFKAERHTHTSLKKFHQAEPSKSDLSENKVKEKDNPITKDQEENHEVKTTENQTGYGEFVNQNHEEDYEMDSVPANESDTEVDAHSDYSTSQELENFKEEQEISEGIPLTFRSIESTPQSYRHPSSTLPYSESSGQSTPLDLRLTTSNDTVSSSNKVYVGNTVNEQENYPSFSVPDLLAQKDQNEGNYEITSSYVSSATSFDYPKNSYHQENFENKEYAILQTFNNEFNSIIKESKLLSLAMGKNEFNTNDVQGSQSKSLCDDWKVMEGHNHDNDFEVYYHDNDAVSSSERYSYPAKPLCKEDTLSIGNSRSRRISLLRENSEQNDLESYQPYMDVSQWHLPQNVDFSSLLWMKKEKKPKKGTFLHIIQETIRIICEKCIGFPSTVEELIDLERSMDLKQRKKIVCLATEKLITMYPELKNDQPFLKVVTCKVRKCLSNKLYYFRNHYRAHLKTRDTVPDTTVK